MTAESFLSSIVEVAIGMAGFAGIIAALRQRNVAHWEAGPRILLQVLFAASGVAIFFALLPALLSEAGLAPENIWRVGSGLLIVWLVGITFYRRLQSRKSGVKTLFFARVILAWFWLTWFCKSLTRGSWRCPGPICSAYSPCL